MISTLMPSGASSIKRLDKRYCVAGVNGSSRIAISYQPANGRKIHNVAAAPLAHPRQHGIGHGDQAKEVGLEHGTNLVNFAFFDGRKIAISRVVHQDVNAPNFSSVCCTAWAICARSVTSSCTASAFSCPETSSSADRDCAPSRPHASPGPARVCKFVAEAGRATGDKPYRRLLLCHSILLSIRCSLVPSRTRTCIGRVRILAAFWKALRLRSPTRLGSSGMILLDNKGEIGSSGRVSEEGSPKTLTTSCDRAPMGQPSPASLPCSPGDDMIPLPSSPPSMLL